MTSISTIDSTILPVGTVLRVQKEVRVLEQSHGARLVLCLDGGNYPRTSEVEVIHCLTSTLCFLNACIIQPVLERQTEN